MPRPDRIGTFARHGDHYRAPVTLSEPDARAVVALAETEGAPVGTVLRRLVRKGLGRRAASTSADTDPVTDGGSRG